MGDVLVTHYPWIKAFHLIAVIAWLAGLFYLPRLFVYHAEAPAGSERAEMLMVMERRLLRAIMNPALIATFVLGGLLLATPGMVSGAEAWLHAKLVLVAGLAGFHMALAAWRRALAEGRNRHTPGFFRVMNEVPTVLVILIVILVVVRPF